MANEDVYVEEEFIRKYLFTTITINKNLTNLRELRLLDVVAKNFLYHKTSYYLKRKK